MASAQELQTRLDHAEAELRRRDRDAAEAKAATLAAQNKTDDAVALAERVAAEAKHRDTLRRGAWASFLIAAADQTAPVDFAALDKQIPADGFPPGLDESKFIIAASPLREKSVDAASTTMGKLLLASRGRI